MFSVSMKSCCQSLSGQRLVIDKPRNITSVPNRQLSFVVENKVRIRFTRMGRKKAPFYRIIAIDSRKRRDGRPLEYLGWYNPMSKETNLNAPAIKKWLGVGAEPSDTVRNLLKKAFVIDE
eukprot:TRINITY_DN1922_c0_g1_i1.p2 TRINITY_DN1922_c0_g1~~TRINITY_DN1922_c0_g1_i1.p2  ORF type:complete len:120 (-),score=10.97 TRINITY_DN1922_c0_g1_i1:215-574(-)